MVWHARLLGMWIYISNRRMKPRQRRDCNHTKRERRDEWKIWKLPIYERSGWKCEICGADIHRGGQIHHVLPYSRFPELAKDERNMMCLCNDCHREVHNNPYCNIRLQEDKGEEFPRLLELEVKRTIEEGLKRFLVSMEAEKQVKEREMEML